MVRENLKITEAVFFIKQKDNFDLKFIRTKISAKRLQAFLKTLNL